MVLELFVVPYKHVKHKPDDSIYRVMKTVQAP